MRCPGTGHQEKRWKTTEEAAMTAGQETVATTAEEIPKEIIRMTGTADSQPRPRSEGRESSEAKTAS